MRGQSQGCHRSVDRGTCRQGIELRNNRDPECRRRSRRRKATPWERQREHPRTPRSQRPRHAWKLRAREPGDPIDARHDFASGPVGEGHEPEVQHARWWGVGRSYVPTKCPNKGGKPSAEGMEGRRPTKENIGQATAPRTQSRISELSDLLGVRRQHGKETDAVHRATPPCDGSTAAGQLLRSEARCCTGSRWSHVERVRDGPG